MTLWGTLGAFVLWSNLPAIDVAFYRCLIGGFLMGGWLIISKESIDFDKNTARAALAGVFLVINWVFLFKSFQVSSITIGYISYYTYPIIFVILGIFIYHEKISLQKWILILLALGGVLLTIDLHNLISPNIILGISFALIAAFFYSFLIILMKYINLNYFKAIFIQLLIGVVILLPFTHFQPLSFFAFICVMIIGVIHTLLAYFLYYNAIKTTTFTQIAVLSYLDPIVAIASDVIFFNRQLNFIQLMGVALTFVALSLLVTTSKSSVQEQDSILK